MALAVALLAKPPVVMDTVVVPAVALVDSAATALALMAAPALADSVAMAQDRLGAV